jgi:amino acid transporter
MSTTPGSLRRSWSALDFGLHAFLVVNPLVLGLWMFSLAPVVGGNLFLAVVLAGPVVVLGAVVFGTLATRWPLTGGDYAWQTRFLDPRVGAVLALASWWFAVATLAPLYGNLLGVEVLGPLLTEAGWDGLASWFRAPDGRFAESLIAISLATAFVGLGMRRAALAQRALVAVGSLAFLAVLALFFTSTPNEFRGAFDEQSAEIYGTGRIASSQIVQIGTLDARVTEIQPADTFTLGALVLLFALWIGWAGPLAGEVHERKAGSTRLALVRAAVVSTIASCVLLVAIGWGMTWDLWNEANNLYWGTIYGTTLGTPLPAWPDPIVFAGWLMDSTVARIALIAGMAAWVVGFAATLFLAATRVLVAASRDGVLPPSVGRTKGDSVPPVALALLVVPACGLAALDAYWDSFAGWTAAAVVALGVTTIASGVAAFTAFRRDERPLAMVSAVFVLLVVLVVGIWIADPVFGLRTVEALVFLGTLYALAGVVYAVGSGRSPRGQTRGV